MPRIVYIILFFGLLGVSFGGPLARFVPELPALTIAFWRMAGASAFLWLSAPMKPQGKLSRSNFPLVIVAGIFLAFHFVCFYSAVKLTAIANASLFATLAPIFTLIYERFVLKRKLPLGAHLGLWLAIGGAIIIQGGELSFNSEVTQGNLLALLSSVFMSVVLIIGERVRTGVTTIMYTRWIYLFAALTLAGTALISNIDLSFNTADTKWLVALMILPTLIGHNSMSYAIKYLRPTIVGAMPFGEPVLASILAWMLFGELVGLSVVIGGVVTLTGLVMLTLNRKPDRF